MRTKLKWQQKVKTAAVKAHKTIWNSTWKLDAKWAVKTAVSGFGSILCGSSAGRATKRRVGSLLHRHFNPFRSTPIHSLHFCSSVPFQLNSFPVLLNFNRLGFCSLTWFQMDLIETNLKRIRIGFWIEFPLRFNHVSNWTWFSMSLSFIVNRLSFKLETVSIQSKLQLNFNHLKRISFQWT